MKPHLPYKFCQVHIPAQYKTVWMLYRLGNTSAISRTEPYGACNGPIRPLANLFNLMKQMHFFTIVTVLRNSLRWREFLIIWPTILVGNMLLKKCTVNLNECSPLLCLIR